MPGIVLRVSHLEDEVHLLGYNCVMVYFYTKYILLSVHFLHWHNFVRVSSIILNSPWGVGGGGSDQPPVEAGFVTIN